MANYPMGANKPDMGEEEAEDYYASIAYFFHNAILAHPETLEEFFAPLAGTVDWAGICEERTDQDRKAKKWGIYSFVGAARSAWFLGLDGEAKEGKQLSRKRNKEWVEYVGVEREFDWRIVPDVEDVRLVRNA